MCEQKENKIASLNLKIGEEFMKKILVMCGTGIATSTMVANRIKDYLNSKGLGDKVNISHASISDKINGLDDYDIILSTTVVPDKIKDKVISAVPLLTGVNDEEIYQEVENKVRE